MSVSVLLRLMPTALTEGRVAGHAEIVDTGESVVFKDLEEMVAFLRGAGARDPYVNGGHDDSERHERSSTHA